MASSASRWRQSLPSGGREKTTGPSSGLTEGGGGTAKAADETCRAPRARQPPGMARRHEGAGGAPRQTNSRAPPRRGGSDQPRELGREGARVRERGARRERRRMPGLGG